MVKTLKFPQNQENVEGGSWYIASRTQCLPSLFKWWPLTFLQQGQICLPIHFYGENVEKSFSQNVWKTKCWILQCMIKVVKLVSYNQNFVPWGLSALAPGLCTCIKCVMSSSLNPFEQFSPVAFCQKGIDNLFCRIPHHWTSWPPCPYMNKST